MTDEADESENEAGEEQEDAGPPPTEAEAFLEQGDLFVKAGAPEFAVESYDRSIAYGPTVAAHYRKGNALHKLGRFTEAEQSFRDALAIDPEDRSTLTDLADELLCLARPDEALRVAEEMLSRVPDAFNMRITAAKAAADLGRFDDAFFHWALLLIYYGVDELYDVLAGKQGGADPLVVGRAIVRALAARPGVEAARRQEMRDEALSRLEPLLDGPSGDEAALLCARVLLDHTARKGEALALVQRSLAAGSLEARCLLGYLLYRGQGLAKDDAASRREHLAAAEGGVADAQFELSIYFDKGIGGDVDAAAARAWEGKAAAQGHHRACLNVASWAATGAHGNTVDMARAVEFYERSARAGSQQAASRLALMYASGQGVAPDEKRALAWGAVAAELGAQ